MVNYLQQHEVYERSFYLQPCDNSRTIPLCERQSFPPGLLQQLMPREERQTDKRGREEERKEVGESVRRLHLHSDGLRQYFSLLSLATKPSLLLGPLIQTNTHFFKVLKRLFFLNASHSSPRHDKPPLLFCCSFHSEYILITQEGFKHLRSPERFLNP